ncbi:hypothetical protein BKA57DRAFT_198496 [Linnemannia elongata]|nr:hypothetical protein BKA57DRAFT_198496 [Linnemannia elongata]
MSPLSFFRLFFLGHILDIILLDTATINAYIMRTIHSKKKKLDPQPKQPNRPAAYDTKHKHAIDPTRFYEGGHVPDYIEKERNSDCCGTQEKKTNIPHCPLGSRSDAL